MPSKLFLNELMDNEENVENNYGKVGIDIGTVSLIHKVCRHKQKNIAQLAQI